MSGLGSIAGRRRSSFMGKALTIFVERMYQQDAPPYGAIMLQKGAWDLLMAQNAYADKRFSGREIPTLKRDA
jgi:hypothetical protein